MTLRQRFNDLAVRNEGAVPLAMTLFALAVVAVTLLTACGPTRNGLAFATPTVPAAAQCADGTMRCADGVPQSCRAHDGVARWWPLTPLATDGSPARCTVCVVSDAGVAGCAPSPSVDASTGDAS